MSRVSRGITHTDYFAQQARKTFIVLLVPALGFDIQHPFPTPSPPSTTENGNSPIPIQLDRLLVPSLPAQFKQISIPPVFRQRQPKKLSHCVTAFYSLFPHACVLLMQRAVQHECALSSTSSRTPVSREERDTGAYFRFVCFLCSFL